MLILGLDMEKIWKGGWIMIKKRHCGDREQRARTEAFDEKKGAAFRRS